MRFTFILKIAATAALVALADRWLLDGNGGIAIGLMATAWLIALGVTRRDVRRSRAARIALVCAAALAAALFDDPGLLGWIMFWCALSMAALLPRAAQFDDAWRWGIRLGLHALAGIGRPVQDVGRLIRARRGKRRSLGATAALLALPLVGGAIFVTLFAAANPLIEKALAAIQMPGTLRIVMWLFLAFCIWPSLRPHPAVMRWTENLPDPEPRLPGASLPSVLIALAVFNALFAVQNALDIAYLWSGGPLPDGMSQTEYVHRGAYPLIGTALIAGVMALAMLRPGSAAAADRRARGLVILWVAQNLILVASSVLRTLDYIQASMLTEWRIAALLWMGLVALGLVLIGWRIWAGRSARWLINRNALAAAIVLGAGCVLDFGAIAATWNVRHQAPDHIDLCYLNGVGEGALLPLIDLERRPMSAETRARVRHIRDTIYDDLYTGQQYWSHWTPRGARRLAAAYPVLGKPRPEPDLPAGAWWNCDGSIGREPAPTTTP